MSSLLLPRRFYSQPQGAVSIDWSNRFVNKTVWLSCDMSQRLIRDAVTSADALNPGGSGVHTDGVHGTFNGSQYVAKSLKLPSFNPANYVVAARIRATAGQAGTPGAAFGAFASSNQVGFGVGFNGTNQIGAGWLNPGAAGFSAYTSASLNTWYTVIVHSKNPSSNMSLKAWIDGVPATTNQGSSTGGTNNTIDEICIGAQHRSSGYLRPFTGDIMWAAVLYYPGSADDYTFTDDDAQQLYQSGYPFTALRASE